MANLVVLKVPESEGAYRMLDKLEDAAHDVGADTTEHATRRNIGQTPARESAYLS